MARPPLRFIELRGYSILQQLHLEERLFYKNQENWCIFNDGTADPAIVMGATGNANELLDLRKVVKDRIPVVRRRSGGGTVVVDGNTMFVSLIISKQPFLRINTDGVTAWCNDLYKIVFNNLPGFQLQSTDHAIGQRKFGGSAQMIHLHKRSVLHTSFLWDYEPTRMSYLSMPRRVPDYRLGRSHLDFICRLKDFLPYRGQFRELLETGLKDYFTLQPSSIDDIQARAEEYSGLAKIIPLEELQSLLEKEKEALASL